MNYVDIIFLILILFFTITGFRKGLVRALGGIIAIILGFYGASIFYPQISLWLQGLTSIFSGPISHVLAFIMVFIVVNRVAMILVYVLDKIFSIPVIGFVNKLLGAVFGFLAGLLLIGILVLAILSFYNGEVSVFENSKIVPSAEKTINFVKPFIPKSLDLSFLESDWMNNLRDIISSLPENIGSVDDLMTYLKNNTDLPDKIINNIKETQFDDIKNIDIDEIKDRLQNYINNK
ncbi:MAG: CvpA family protein [Patescibacteria group bacterium]|nr:CvpA family protein [Patescibacteria group bacterium]